MNVPKLRFKDDDGREFPGWTLTELKHLAAINPKSNKLPDEFIYIDLESVEKGLLLKEDLLKLNDAPSRAQRLLRQNDILFQMVRPYQRNNLFFNKAGNYVASTGYAQIRAHQVPKFLYYCLHLDEFVTEVMNRCTGTSYPAINSFALSTIELKQPESKYEQTKIADFLTAVDEKISLLTQKSELLVQYKKGVMQKIFSLELRFKDDDGREFPEWEEITLSKLGKSFNGLTGKAGDDFGDGKPYITYKQIFDDSKIDVNKFSYVQIAENENQNQVKYGDVFFTTSSETPEEVGYCSVLLNDVSNVYLNSFCFGYRINSFDKLHPNFARFIFKSPDFRRDVVKLAQGSTRYNISKTNFMEITIQLPVIDEQNKIANFLTAIDDKISQTQAELDAVKQYKQGLLQQMFV